MDRGLKKRKFEMTQNHLHVKENQNSVGMAKDGKKIEDACIFLLSQTILEDKSLCTKPQWMWKVLWYLERYFDTLKGWQAIGFLL